MKIALSLALALLLPSAAVATDTVANPPEPSFARALAGEDEVCDFQENECITPTMFLIDGEDSVPLPANTVKITGYNTREVTFTIAQTFGTISWMAAAYVHAGKDDLSCAPVVPTPALNSKQTYTATCSGGSAKIEFFVHSPTYTNATETNKNGCDSTYWGDDTGIAMYKMELSCSAAAVCGDDVDPVDLAVEPEDTSDDSGPKKLKHRCRFPKNTARYSLITKGDAYVQAMELWGSVSIGGLFRSGNGKGRLRIGTVTKWRSFMYQVVGKCDIHFEGTVKPYQDAKLVRKSTSWGIWYWLAQTLEDYSGNGKTVVVVKKGGTYSIDDVCPGCLQQSRRILVVFDTTEDVNIVGNGKPFEASILAPRAKVILHGSAIYVSGFIVADSFTTFEADAETLIIKGQTFNGAMSCGETASPTQSPTAAETIDMVCHADDIMLVNDEDAYPMKFGSIAVTNPDNTDPTTVEVTYTNKFGRKLGFINFAYDNGSGEISCPDTVRNFKNGNSKTITAKCDAEGFAQIEIFAQSSAFKKARQENYRGCVRWTTTDYRVSQYIFKVSCDGTKLCTYVAPPPPPTEEEKEFDELKAKCKFPSRTKDLSVITRGDADISASEIWSGIAIGGALKNTWDKRSKVDIALKRRKVSWFMSLGNDCDMYFNGGVISYTDYNRWIKFDQFKWLAKNLHNMETPKGYEIKIFKKGGTIKVEDFNESCDATKNGRNTLLVFDTTEDVNIVGSTEECNFLASILAPFSKVTYDDTAGYLDGFVVADSFATTGDERSTIKIRGNYFNAPLRCWETAAPTYSPTSGPTSGPTTQDFLGTNGSNLKFNDPEDDEEDDEKEDSSTVTNKAGSNGDPHFRTWRNEHFEYHGQCDMILTRDEQFANGVGLDVQIRTKLVRFWSYIKSAAIRIGDDILEVQGSGNPTRGETHYWINFMYGGKLDTIGGFPVTLTVRSVNQRVFRIDLSSKYPGQMIVISTYKEFVRVDFQEGTEESFGNTIGLLGDFKTGETLARDGKTIIDDFTAYGNEWQVLPKDNMLFHDVSQPQFPKRCLVPEDPRGERRRRLDEAGINEEEAEAACARLTDDLDRKDCVYDILATQDLGMVGAF